jgi:hypothetical protein
VAGPTFKKIIEGMSDLDFFELGRGEVL